MYRLLLAQKAKMYRISAMVISFCLWHQPLLGCPFSLKFNFALSLKKVLYLCCRERVTPEDQCEHDLNSETFIPLNSVSNICICKQLTLPGTECKAELHAKSQPKHLRSLHSASQTYLGNLSQNYFANFDPFCVLQSAECAFAQAD